MRNAHRLLFSSVLLSTLALLILANFARTQAPTAPLATGTFVDSGQSLGGAVTNGVAAGDLDGDGDLDLFMANTNFNTVFNNDGLAQFTDSGQNLGTQSSNGVALGDIDGDKDLDAVVANVGANRVWSNNGAGLFLPLFQPAAAISDSQAVALGDLDGDNDLDVFIANIGANQILLNGEGGDPVGLFRDSLQTLGTAASRAVVLGDVDGDDDLDAVVANGSSSFEPSKLWLNQGGAQGGTEGTFVDSGQALDGSWNAGVAAGDLDGDLDLDLLFSSWNSPGSVWLNQGGTQLGTQGQFSNTLQLISGAGSLGIALADVDGDSDQDLFVSRFTGLPSELWLNQGGDQLGQQGVYTLTQSFGASATFAVAAADLDADNDPDLVMGNFGANHVWYNCSDILIASFAVDARTNGAGRLVFPWAAPGDASLPVRLSCPATQPLTVTGRIKSASSAITRAIPFSPGDSSRNLSVANPAPTPSETFTLTLGLDLGHFVRSKLSGLQIGTMNLVFVEPAQGQTSCWLCFVDWMLKLLGFDTTFWMLHHVEMPGLQNSLSWGYYTRLFEANSQELASVVATHPSLLWKSLEVLEGMTPLVEALGQGQGDLAVIDNDFATDFVELVEGIRDNARPALAGQLQFEMDALDLDTMEGLNMNEVESRLQDRIRGELFLPLTVGAGP